MFAFVCFFLYIYCRGSDLGIGYIVATQGSVGLSALLHNFLRVTEGNVFLEFDLSDLFLFGPFWAIPRVGAMAAGTVGAVRGILTLSVLVPFLAALRTNCLTVTSGFAMTVALTIVASQRIQNICLNVQFHVCCCQ